MTTSISSRSLPASPQSVNSNETSSSSEWSNPRSSLLDQDDRHNHRHRGIHSQRASGSGSGSGIGIGRERLSSNESGITNPSSFGSMLALLNSQSPNNQMNLIDEVDGHGENNSAYSQGNHLSRRAWFEMDAEMEAIRHHSTPIEWDYKPVTKSEDTAMSFTDSPTYCCARCGTTLALQDELISKAFSGRDGKAFLFFSILNSKVGPKEDRQLLTGLHTVADLSCKTCQRSVGWCYLRAFEASQRYKEGKFILERAALHKSNNWQLDDDM